MQQDERSGLLLALSGFALLSVGDAIIKTMAGQWSPLAVAALRFTIGAAALSALLFVTEGAAAFRPRKPWLQVARGACLAGATLCFFSAIFVMPLADAMAIAFVSPIFVALFSGPLLGEKVRPVVWLVSLVALGGVALILRPNLAELGIVALLPLASAFFFALMVVANRSSAGQGSALSMQAFIALWATPFLIAAALIGDRSSLASLVQQFKQDGVPYLAFGFDDPLAAGNHWWGVFVRVPESLMTLELVSRSRKARSLPLQLETRVSSLEHRLLQAERAVETARREAND